MQPVSPVVIGLEPYEIVIGENQPDVIPLPSLCGPSPYYVKTSRWHLDAEERALIAAGADIFLSQQSFGHAYQPTNLSITPVPGTLISMEELEAVKMTLQLDEELNERLRQLFT